MITVQVHAFLSKIYILLIKFSIRNYNMSEEHNILQFLNVFVGKYHSLNFNPLECSCFGRRYINTSYCYDSYCNFFIVVIVIIVI